MMSSESRLTYISYSNVFIHTRSALTGALSLVSLHIGGFLRLWAENMGYCCRSSHIKFRFCYFFMLLIKCCTELASLFCSKWVCYATASSITFLFPSVG